MPIKSDVLLHGGADRTTPAHAAPTGLLCDLLARPDAGALATTKPTFGWIVNGGQPGPPQAAYQIRVAASVDALAGESGAVWASGKKPSSQSINVPYAGEPLASGKSYWWTVRTWAAADEGEPSAWAEPQRFVIAEKPSDEGDVSVYRLQTVRVSGIKMERIAEGAWAVDFGRQAFGWLELEIDSAVERTTVTVRLGEAWRGGALDRTPPGSVRYAEAALEVRQGRRIYRVETPADARNTGPAAIPLPAELGVVMPFRYAEVETANAGVALVGATLVRVQYPFDEDAAAFSSSSAELDEVWELCRYTMLATSFAGYYVDGDRERIPYEADAYINQLSHYAVDREFSLARRTHEYLLVHPTWPTEWKQHSILIAWADYEATGDDRSLRRHYATLKRDKLLLNFARADGLLETGQLRDPAGPADVGDLVDWPPVERDGFEFRRVNTVINAFHYRTLVLMEKIARAVGEDGDAALFAERATVVFGSFNLSLFDVARGIYVDGEGSAHASQHANLFPLAFGLVPAHRRDSVAAYVKSRGIACSVYPAQFLLEGLFEAREAAHAIGLMTGGGLRSWRNMLDHGATLTWEAWDQSLKPNQDWNHAWGAAPGNIIARHVLGVRPLEPGYGRVLIDPQLGDLAEVRGMVPTIRGPVRVKAWRDAAGHVRCDATVPANLVCEYGAGVIAVGRGAGLERKEHV